MPAPPRTANAGKSTPKKHRYSDPHPKTPPHGNNANGKRSPAAHRTTVEQTPIIKQPTPRHQRRANTKGLTMVTLKQWADTLPDTPSTVWIDGTVTSIEPRRDTTQFTLTDPANTLTCTVATTIAPAASIPPGTQISVLGTLTLTGAHLRPCLVVTELRVVTPAGTDQTAKPTVALPTPNKHLKWPDRVRVIGLVRPVRGTDGVEDFLATLAAAGQIRIINHPTPMAARQDALNVAGAIIKASIGTDLVAVIRGGGTGLELFNSDAIRTAIDTSPVPVILGIGHTNDATTIDKHAYHTAITPTAAGTWLHQQLQAPESVIRM